MPFAPPPPSQIETPASPLAEPTFNNSYSPPELKVEPISPSPVLNDNTEVSNSVPNVPVNLP